MVLIVSGQLFLLREVGEAVVERLLPLQGEVQLVEERWPAAFLLALEALGHVRVLAPGGDASLVHKRNSERDGFLDRLVTILTMIFWISDALQLANEQSWEGSLRESFI